MASHDLPDIPIKTIESFIPEYERVRQSLADLVAARAMAELVWEDENHKEVIGIIQDITEQKKTGSSRSKADGFYLPFFVLRAISTRAPNVSAIK